MLDCTGRQAVSTAGMWGLGAGFSGSSAAPERHCTHPSIPKSFQATALPFKPKEQQKL